MTTTSTMTVWLSLCAATGCLSPSPSPEFGEETEVTPAAITNTAVIDIPAVNHQLYPDNLGFVHQGQFASVLWLQSRPKAEHVSDLAQVLARRIEHGLSGEFLSTSVQQVDPILAVQPSLEQIGKATVQSARQMGQYTVATADYSDALGSALATFNADPARRQTILDAATRVSGELAALSSAGSITISRPPVAASQQVIRPGTYFADAVRAHARDNLTKRTVHLEAAITARNPAAYADSFTAVFLAQRDADLTQDAALALAAHHANGLLHGQPFDPVIAQYVHPLPAADRPLAVDQLSLINRINLLSSDVSKPRQALVAALLLIDEDHRQSEQDATLSSDLIWQHVSNTAWLVAQLVRIQGGATTEAQVNAKIASILASL